MDFKYITIEREYGSGGQEIGEKTAEKCNLNCYGRKILEMVAEKNKVPVSRLEEYEESTTGSFLYSLLCMSKAQSCDPDMLPEEGKLYVAENRMIKSVADSGPAVFVGRCAAEALKDKEGVLRVFIRASDDYKIKRIVECYGVEKKDVISECKRINKKRAAYYEFVTHRKWDDYKNYDIILDSSKIGIDGCVNALAGIYLK